ncbi:unnamed protein product [Parnassius apollo]|uniref:(apollo) hypothetical protein n=1 Tax=Parnassius apollo TaxID=110799 RepID=A0A8S3XWN6_PARAO|nr:unnamed protein product [Parnassius apollo]
MDYPRYAFNYAINDPFTSDNKAQWEARNGDVVKGAYSLREPDGSIRVVEYSANDISGFNAIVKNIGVSAHPATVKALLTKTSEGVVPIIPLAPIDIGPVAHLAPVKVRPVDPKLNYGFGAAPLAIGLPKVTSLGHWSLPWDPVTRSYGGWVPLNGPAHRGPYATVYSNHYINGKLHQWYTGPIELKGKKIVIKTKP